MFTLCNDPAETFLARHKKQADVIFTSPPYNIGSKSPRIDGHRKTGGFDPKSYGGITGYPDAMDEAAYQKQQVRVVKACATALKEDGVLVYNHKPRRRDGAMIHPIVWLSKVKTLTLMEEIIWDRGSTHNHSDRMMWPHTESLYVFRRTDGVYRLRNTSDLKFRSNLWHIPLTSRPALGHAAPFPSPLADAVMAAFARIGDLVLDPYSGSGTTGVAALAHGCRYAGSDLSADYLAASEGRLAAVLAVAA